MIHIHLIDFEKSSLALVKLMLSGKIRAPLVLARKQLSNSFKKPKFSSHKIKKAKIC